LFAELTNCSPAGAQLGEKELIVGMVLRPLVTVKFIRLEVPPPGAGLVTVTASVPAEAMLAAGMTAVNCAELTNVVAGADPPKLTIEAATKFAPLIVIVKAAPPDTLLFGEIVVIVGVGLDSLDGGGVDLGVEVGVYPAPHPPAASKANSNTFFMPAPILAAVRPRQPTLLRSGVGNNSGRMVRRCSGSDHAAC
jgi:hypothetical protein